MTKGELRTAIGENLRAARVSRGLSIKHLAGVMEITPGYLGLIEHGNRGLTPFMMLKASKELDVPISTFFPKHERE